MIHGSLARRYARALIAIAEESKATAEAGKELYGFSDLMASDRNLYEALISPMLNKDDKDKIIAEVCARLGMSELITNFLRYLNDKGRMEYIGRISRAYQEMEDEAGSRIRAEVTSAAALTEEQSQKVRETLSKLSGRDVIMKVEEEPGLIGGLVVRIGGLLLDGSIRNQLDLIRERMTQESGK